MINKYKRRTINQKADLHDHEFVIYEDVEEVLVKVISKAIECGADEQKLMEFFGDEKTS